MQRSHLLLAIVFAGSACSSQARTDTKDPNAPATEPAVVTLPLPPAPGLPAPEASKGSIIPRDAMRRDAALSQLYALAAAMMINQDIRNLSQLHTSDATLALPDSTVHGAPAIARAWTEFAKAKSLEDFQRSSEGVKVLDDSTLTDSGTYTLVMRRTPKDSVVERGRYATTVRARANTDGWAMMADRLTPASTKKGKK